MIMLNCVDEGREEWVEWGSKLLTRAIILRILDLFLARVRVLFWVRRAALFYLEKQRSGDCPLFLK